MEIQNIDPSAADKGIGDSNLHTPIYEADSVYYEREFQLMDRKYNLGLTCSLAYFVAQFLYCFNRASTILSSQMDYKIMFLNIRQGDRK